MFSKNNLPQNSPVPTPSIARQRPSAAGRTRAAPPPSCCRCLFYIWQDFLIPHRQMFSGQNGVSLGISDIIDSSRFSIILTENLLMILELFYSDEQLEPIFRGVLKNLAR